MSKADKMFEKLKMEKNESITTVNGVVTSHIIEFKRVTHYEFSNSEIDSVIVNVLHKNVQIRTEHKEYSIEVVSATYELLKELGWLE